MQNRNKTNINQNRNKTMNKYSNDNNINGDTDAAMSFKQVIRDE